MRKCSQCGNTGHNSRTCRNASSRAVQNGQIMKLFGVELVNLQSSSNDITTSTNLLSFSEDCDKSKIAHFSTGTASQPHRKKGVAWSEEEHRLFLMGLEKLGKGNWRGISKNFVTTRTSTQVASHAQKYFLRLNNANKAFLSLLGRNEAESRMYSSTSRDCIYSMRRIVPINPPYTLPEIPSLELSLNVPPPPQPPRLPAWTRWPLVIWKKQYLHH